MEEVTEEETMWLGAAPVSQNILGEIILHAVGNLILRALHQKLYCYATETQNMDEVNFKHKG